MRISTLAIAIAAVSLPLWAQQNRPPKLSASKADVDAMIAKAKSDRKPDQANFVQTIVREAPYNVNLEYRVANVNSPPTVHEHDAEFFMVVDGSATMTTGGKLRDEKRTNAANLSGSAIDGGTSKHIAKGDFILVPENTPHGFSDIDGTLVLMSLHLPRNQ